MTATQQAGNNILFAIHIGDVGSVSRGEWGEVAGGTGSSPAGMG